MPMFLLPYTFTLKYRKVRERIAINDTSYKRDEDGYFVEVSLKPVKVPETCPCGVSTIFHSS